MEESMTTQDAPQLLPCPFCGAEAKLETDFYDCNHYWVICQMCGAISDSAEEDRDKPIAAWNRRAPLPDTERATLTAQVALSEQRHAECTTSLITEVRRVERLKARIVKLEAQLADTTTQRDTASRNAKHYADMSLELEARIAELEAERDPEILAIAYGKGYSDAQDKARKRIAALEQQLATEQEDNDASGEHSHTQLLLYRARIAALEAELELSEGMLQQVGMESNMIFDRGAQRLARIKELEAENEMLRQQNASAQE